MGISFFYDPDNDTEQPSVFKPFSSKFLVNFKNIILNIQDTSSRCILDLLRWDVMITRKKKKKFMLSYIKLTLIPPFTF